ncbi:hypothetical protein BYT27DRAFT_7170533 [Phlegmacium glaucopus]|nr:hypothetical protein BYT27DRAFT_7170533 [Phlegmacium glaucopus]
MGESAFRIPAIFSLKPIKPDSIPSDEAFISDSKTLLDASVSWQAGRVYQGVNTFQQRQHTEEAGTTHLWYTLVSVLHKDEISFKGLWSKMGIDKICKQRRYLPAISKVTRVKYISESQSIWTVLYTPSSPFSPRIYTVLQASWLLEYSHKRRGIIVTIPIDLSSKSTRNLAELEEKGVRGLYVCVEHIQEMAGDIIEWRRVACLDPGGFIPKFMAQKSILNKLIEVNDPVI